MESEFKVGQDVFYQGHEVTIEDIYDNGTCKINNPLWDDDDDDTPFWITVNLSDLKYANI